MCGYLGIDLNGDHSIRSEAMSQQRSIPPSTGPDLAHSLATMDIKMFKHRGNLEAGDWQADPHPRRPRCCQWQEILYQPGRRIEIILGEAALWNTPSTIDTLRGQLDRLISFAALPSLVVGVVSREVSMPIAPLACFAVYDNEFVLAETLTGEQRLDDPDEVGIYIKAFDQLRDASAIGPEAIGLIRRVIDELRG